MSSTKSSRKTSIKKKMPSKENLNKVIWILILSISLVFTTFIITYNLSKPGSETNKYFGDNIYYNDEKFQTVGVYNYPDNDLNDTTFSTQSPSGVYNHSEIAVLLNSTVTRRYTEEESWNNGDNNLSLVYPTVDTATHFTLTGIRTLTSNDTTTVIIIFSLYVLNDDLEVVRFFDTSAPIYINLPNQIEFDYNIYFPIGKTIYYSIATNKANPVNLTMSFQLKLGYFD